jgi:hypothetical protein
MTAPKFPICMACSRYRSGGTCAAFPSGIPEDILFGQFDHRQPHPGDNGILFEVGNPEALAVWDARVVTHG